MRRQHMRILVLFGIIGLYLSAFVATSTAQCVSTPDDPCVSVKQSLIDRAAATATELKHARDVIAAFELERATSQAERIAAQALIKSLNDVMDVRGRIITEYERMQVVYQKVIDMQAQLIERQSALLNKGKSGWDKFLVVLKTVGAIALGIVIGGL
jgi:hypothetical protein